MPDTNVSGLVVDIVAGKDAESSTVTVSGSVQRVVTRQDISDMQLSNDNIKRGIEAFGGKAPDSVFVVGPTPPPDDLFAKYGWQQTTVVLSVVKSEVIGLENKPVIINSDKLQNHTKETATFKADVTSSASTDVSMTWEESFAFTVGQKITYKIGIGVAELGGETSFEFQSSMGKSETKSESFTVGSDAGISVDLPPGEEAVAQLTATRGSLKIRVTYEASLGGNVAVNYGKPYKLPGYDQGHHFYGVPIAQILAAANLPSTFMIVEDIEVGFYSDINAELTGPPKAIA